MEEKTKQPVINLMEAQKKVKNKGGTMRLGAYPCDIKKGTKAWGAYGKSRISERHRHRYEFNNKYLKQYNEAGMIAYGVNHDSGLVEMIELKNLPRFAGCKSIPVQR